MCMLPLYIKVLYKIPYRMLFNGRINYHQFDMVCLACCCRFPLFGGWQTFYYTGYNLPSYEYLYHAGSHYMLKMRFVDHVFDNQVIEKTTVRIILPEGARCVGGREGYTSAFAQICFHKKKEKRV